MRRFLDALSAALEALAADLTKGAKAYADGTYLRGYADGYSDGREGPA